MDIDRIQINKEYMFIDFIIIFNNYYNDLIKIDLLIREELL